MFAVVLAVGSYFGAEGVEQFALFGSRSGVVLSPLQVGKGLEDPRWAGRLMRNSHVGAISVLVAGVPSDERSTESRFRMIVYQRTQCARTLVLAKLYAVLLVALVVGFLDPDTALPALALTTSILVTAMLFLGFRSLMVTVTPSELELAYSLGWPTKRLERSRIVSVEPLGIRWWDGGGMGLISKGWMWNIWGVETVRLTFSDGQCLLIGTDDPEGLTSALS